MPLIGGFDYKWRVLFDNFGHTSHTEAGFSQTTVSRCALWDGMQLYNLTYACNYLISLMQCSVREGTADRPPQRSNCVTNREKQKRFRYPDKSFNSYWNLLPGGVLKQVKFLRSPRGRVNSSMGLISIIAFTLILSGRFLFLTKKLRASRPLTIPILF